CISINLVGAPASSWGILRPLGCKYVEVQNRFITQNFAPMRDAARDYHEPSGAEVRHLIPDMEAHPSFNDIRDLFVRMTVRLRVVPRHETVQRDCSTAAGERLLLH